jgi:transcriptional regulator with XRE-family HTH domain
VRKPVLKKVGDQIRQLRKQAGLSQEELAERCELHRNYVGGIERGERNVSLLNLCLIAAALEVGPGDLLVGIDASDLLALRAEKLNH